MSLLQQQPEEQRIALTRTLCQTDLYFLLRYALGRADVEKPWLFDRCREVQASPNGYLDLWAREHYKSTIITYALNIQEILRNPEVTIGIFSHTLPIAKGFLRQIKRELEGNEFLKSLFPDILWENPQAQAPKWSEDDGIIVKRKTNPKEATVEAWGVVDGQPTSKHFQILDYDDVVTKESVTTPDMILKTTDALALSYNLGTMDGIRRFVGTRYHFNDSYKALIDRDTAIVRLHTCTEDGEIEGEPVLLTREQLRKKRKDMGPYVFACQMMQNPVADETQGFKEAWLKYYPQGSIAGDGMNIYMLVDAASEKKKGSDYTAIRVWGLNSDGNAYLLDSIRDRLNLTQRGDNVMRLHRKWRPLGVGYEKYGLMADIEYIKDRQNRENYRFEIIELGGQQPKPDRIRRMIPMYEQGRVYLPDSMHRTNHEGLTVDLTFAFVEEEYKAFPVSLHDDMLDADARLWDEDMHIIWPETVESVDRYRGKQMRRGSAMSA